MKTLLTILAPSIFWIWNITFLLLYIWMLPAIVVGLVKAIFAGEIESEFLIPLFGLIATPTVCTLIGGWRLRKRPLELMRLFYGVEAPLFTLCLVRLFVVRELTPASTLILGTGMVCVLAFISQLLIFGNSTKQIPHSPLPISHSPLPTPYSPLPHLLTNSATCQKII